MQPLSEFKKTEIGYIPKNWELGKVLDSSVLKGRIGWQGLTTAEYRQEGKFYLVTGTDFKGGKIDWKNCVYVEEQRYNQDENIKLKEEDVLVTKDGTIGKIAYIDTLPHPATLNTGIFVIRPINKVYFSLFLYYILNSHYFIGFLSRLKAGSTISHLYQKDFVNFRFPIPPYFEQQKISYILSKVDKLIQKTDQIIEQTQRLKKGLMHELLTKGIGHNKFKETELGRIPQEWALTALNRIVSISGGRRVPLGEKLLDEKTPYPYIRIIDFKDETIDSSNIKYLNEQTFKKISRYTISSDDIYISIAGVYLGKAGMVPSELSGANLTENAAKLYDFKGMSKGFLVYYLNSNLAQNQIKSLTGTNSQPKLALYRLATLKVPVPTLTEQKKISSTLSYMNILIRLKQQRRNRIVNLKKGLMQQLLTGRTRVKV